MAYYNGSAADMSQVRTALVDACVTEGWTWNAGTEVLSKGVAYLRLQVTSGYLTLLGRTAPTSGDAPNVSRMGNLSAMPVTYPAIYHIFVFDSEVYMVINYNVDFYQWCAFGISTVQGLPGTGMWFGSTMEQNNTVSNGISISAVDGNNTNQTVTPALFWATSIQLGSRNRNCYVHSNLDSEGWNLTISGGSPQVGVTSMIPLIGLLPNNWNTETVLLPLRCYKYRPSSKTSLIVDCENSRCIRIDNYDPGQVITLGSDQWMLFPWYRKNTASRNGGNDITHSGTFGWAIRYEGP